ncbi:MAG: glycosyltransferase family 4 protein, partial [Nostocaceae cyanobacterium]|nr:glycosyltransferase family 4 protein [Nostocaceae cyanobacterium]
VKVVWTVHEFNDPKLYGGGKIPPISARILGRFFNAIITHCDSIKSEITKLFSLSDEDKVVVIPHGNYISCYENNLSRLQSREALGIPSESLVFLFFGSIYRYKGILETIKAFKSLQNNDVYLVIAGDVKEHDLKQVITDEIDDSKQILFLPQIVPNSKIQLYMNACDSVIVPYKEFTTSGVIILAMSYGRVCIAPNLGFFSDVLDDSRAFLYDSTNEQGLLQAMKLAIENKERLLEMGDRNLKLAEEWNWDYVAEKTLNVYNL